MPTAEFSEYVELVGSGSTLLVGSRAIVLQEHTDLLSVGSSRGSDLVVGDSDGRLSRARSRDSLSVSLRVHLDGRFDEEGDPVGDPVANGFVLVDKVVGFMDDEDREFTLRLTLPSGSREAEARFEEFGRWSRPAPHLWKVSMLLTVPAGILS